MIAIFWLAVIAIFWLRLGVGHRVGVAATRDAQDALHEPPLQNCFFIRVRFRYLLTFYGRHHKMSRVAVVNSRAF